MSYFHEYFLDTGQKTLREYSGLVDLKIFDDLEWRITEELLFEIPERLDKGKHFKILSASQIKNLRKSDRIEIKVGKIVEWKKK